MHSMCVCVVLVPWWRLLLIFLKYVIFGLLSTNVLKTETISNESYKRGETIGTRLGKQIEESDVGKVQS